MCLLTLAAMFSATAYAQQFSDWSVPENVGPPVNSAAVDFQPFVTKDGLSMYFVRQTGIQDIWVSHRATIEEPWGGPELLPSTVSGPTTNEGTPFVTVDGHWLYFVSTRAGGFGKNDIYVSWRPNKLVDSGPGGWQAPVNLGSGVNSNQREQAPALFEDELTGAITLYFNSDRTGNDDIYASTMQADGSFGPASPVSELNTGSIEQHPTVRRNGREIYFASDRPGSLVRPEGQLSVDIWVSTRSSTLEAWSEPEPATMLNSPFHEGRPSLSFDGSTIYFHSAERVGNVSICCFDIWMATREKLQGLDDN
jgi:Tol biopolymer transport system component